jgi:hypothetical protein
MAAWLQRISTPEALSGHPALGPLFETYVVTNILRRLGAVEKPEMLRDNLLVLPYDLY